MIRRSYHIDGSAPKPGQVFVFGSNLSGHHSGGAAAAATTHYGAVWGAASGRTGQSYAIPTVNEDLSDRLHLVDIKASVTEFLIYAGEHPDETFFVTRIGCGIAGHQDQDIAPMFLDAPSNCCLPDRWMTIIEGAADEAWARQQRFSS